MQRRTSKNKNNQPKNKTGKNIKNQSLCFPTGSASDVHGFEIAGFDDAHSDGVGGGIVAQRHQQVSSASLEKLNANSKKKIKAPVCPFYALFIPLASACCIFYFFWYSSSDCLRSPPVYLSASPYSRLSPIPPARRHISPESTAAARNDITHYILSHLPSSHRPSTPHPLHL